MLTQIISKKVKEIVILVSNACTTQSVSLQDYLKSTFIKKTEDSLIRLEFLLLMEMLKMEMITLVSIPFLILARVIFSQLRSKLMTMITGSLMKISLFNFMMQTQTKNLLVQTPKPESLS